MKTMSGEFLCRGTRAVVALAASVALMVGSVVPLAGATVTGASCGHGPACQSCAAGFCFRHPTSTEAAAAGARPGGNVSHCPAGSPEGASGISIGCPLLGPCGRSQPIDSSPAGQEPAVLQRVVGSGLVAHEGSACHYRRDPGTRTDAPRPPDPPPRVL
ncbi:MAG: hypothetical protein ACE5HV_03010 [Acidobacteriota bacterium]